MSAAQWGWIEMPEFGAEKGLLQGQARRVDGLCAKPPKLSGGLGQGTSLYKQNLGWGPQGVWLSSDRWWGNRAEVHESCAQPGVTTSTWVDAFSSCGKTQRYCFVYTFQRNGELVLWLQYCFLTASPLFLHPLPPLMSSCLNLPFRTQGRSRRLNETYYLQMKNRGPRKALCPEGPHRVLLSFMPTWPNKTKQKQLNTKSKIKESDHLWSWVCSSRSHIELLQWTRHCNRHSRNKDIPSPQGSSLLVCKKMVSPVTDVWSSKWQPRWSDWGLCSLHLWSYASPSACLTNRQGWKDFWI